MKKTPRNLEVGMHVKALSISDYVVVRVGSEDSHPAAYLAIRGEEEREPVAVTERYINPQNRAVMAIRGQKIQHTNYYYEG